ncbi:MAG TPA: hypothetical protein VK013_01075 [Myxococcaceae bacterium]|nr:hypothetical protein [Myxococcaceae bacterium]
MRWRSPQGRLLLSGALLAGLVLTAIARQQGWGGSGVWIAVACLAGAGWLWKQGSLGRPGTPEEIPLEVRARTGLSPRCGLALIEAEGERYLVVHGDGFATVHGMPRREPPELPVGAADARVLRAQKGLWQ